MCTDSLLTDSAYDFMGRKLKTKQRLTQKDHDKLEFFNIAKTFRTLNQNPLVFKDLNPGFVRDIHRQITQGLDIFKNICRILRSIKRVYGAITISFGWEIIFRGRQSRLNMALRS